jgi:hypothetical protein
MTEAALDLVSTASATALTRDPIVALAQRGSPSELVAALHIAVDRDDVRAATALALAAAVAGAKIPAPLVLRLGPDIEVMEHLPPIVAQVDGEPFDVLLELAGTGRLSWEREALVLYFAARLVRDTVPPPSLTSRLRSFLREPLTVEAELLAGMAAALVNDAEVKAVAGGALLAAGNLGIARGLDEELWSLFSEPAVNALREREWAPMGPVVTVVRAEPKVGRNDPCSCGSGKKYKKCCAGKEAPAAAPRSVLEQFQEIGDRSPRVKQQLFEALRVPELERLDLDALTSLQLAHGVRQLMLHHRWEGAERYVEALEGRTDLPWTEPGDYRCDLAMEALRAGQLDLAERQMALANADGGVRRIFDVELALARNAPDALDRLELALHEGLQHDRGLLIECVFALLRHRPALGILAARGAIGADRMLDSEELLRAIGTARDRLGLPAEEPWEEIFELLVESYFGSVDDEDEEGDAVTDQLRSDLREAAAHSRRLGEELAKRERQLEQVGSERARLAAEIAAQQGRDDRRRVAELEDERQRLRTKIAQLKGAVAEGVDQRAELRRELARSADERAARVAPSATVPPVGDEAPDEVEGDSAAQPRNILVPHFTPAAERSLASLPRRTASDALLDAARLAGGDVQAWSGAKHMQRAHDILSARVGRKWRLLFRIAGERLEVLEVVHRRELDGVIARLSR